ncbi:MAG: hypothetical protein IJH09_03420 [Clostridia bacterium]|nr:hypothetical protein [Clostridia bacterium]
MKITSFNPMIITNRAEEVLKVFEQWGFNKKHAPTLTMASGTEFTDYRLQSEEGFYMDVAAIDMPLPMEVPAIRINVDDFDEAYRMLTEVGYKPTHEGAFMENEHSKSVALVGPIGFTIYLVQHKK